MSPSSASTTRTSSRSSAAGEPRGRRRSRARSAGARGASDAARPPRGGGVPRGRAARAARRRSTRGTTAARAPCTPTRWPTCPRDSRRSARSPGCPADAVARQAVSAFDAVLHVARSEAGRRLAALGRLDARRTRIAWPWMRIASREASPRSAPRFDGVAATVQRLAVLLAAGVAPLSAWRHARRAATRPVSPGRSPLPSSRSDLPHAIRSSAHREPAERAAWRAVAAAWSVAGEVGAPLAPTLARLAEVLRGARPGGAGGRARPRRAAGDGPDRARPAAARAARRGRARGGRARGAADHAGRAGVPGRRRSRCWRAHGAGADGWSRPPATPIRPRDSASSCSRSGSRAAAPPIARSTWCRRRSLAAELPPLDDRASAILDFAASAGVPAASPAPRRGRGAAADRPARAPGGARCCSAPGCCCPSACACCRRSCCSASCPCVIAIVSTTVARMVTGSDAMRVAACRAHGPVAAPWNRSCHGAARRGEKRGTNDRGDARGHSAAAGSARAALATRRRAPRLPSTRSRSWRPSGSPASWC